MMAVMFNPFCVVEVSHNERTRRHEEVKSGDGSTRKG